MSLIIPANTLASGGYEVDNSLRFNDGSSDYLNRTPGSAGNRKTFTFSTWVKRGSLSGNKALFSATPWPTTPWFHIQFEVDQLKVGVYDTTYEILFVTTPVYRDVSAWYHVVVAIDTTQGTESNRLKIYINGVQVTSFDNEIYPSLNFETAVNNNVAHYIGDHPALGYYYDGYMAEVCLIDGQQLDATDFGEFDEDSGIWKPIDVSGLTFGTNGFYLDFEDSAALGDDVSGNGNDWTVNNLTAIDQTTDTPTNNFATMNPLFYQSATAVTYSNGNCTTSSPTTGGTAPVSTIEVPKTGKWYCEIKVDSTTGTISDNSRIGIAVPLASNAGNPTYNARYLSNGNYTLDASGAAYGATFAATDIIGIAVDSDSNTIEFYKNGVSQGSLSYTMQSNETYFFTASEASNTIGINYSYNFGNPPFTISSGNADDNGHGNFEYLPPSGYLSLCTKNLSEILS